MMVSPVSFRAADASAWNSLLEKKQTFQNPTEQPAAASAPPRQFRPGHAQENGPDPESLPGRNEETAGPA